MPQQIDSAEFQDFVRLSATDHHDLGFHRSEEAVRMTFRIEYVIVRKANHLARPVTVSAFEQVHMRVRPGDRERSHKLARRRRSGAADTLFLLLQPAGR